jgi:hypothetical protein
VADGDAPDKPGWVRRLLRWLNDVVPNWVQAVAAVLTLFGVALGGSKALEKDGKSVTETVSVPQHNRPSPKAKAVYLSRLPPGGGDIPMRGDTQIGDQDFPYSIFYDNVPDNESNASACQNVEDPTCRATDYSIASGRYHRFSANIGVTGCSGDKAHWSLSVDNVVVRSGPAALNSSPQRVSVAIPTGDDLELLVSTSAFSGAACGAVNINWGNARLS